MCAINERLLRGLASRRPGEVEGKDECGSGAGSPLDMRRRVVSQTSPSVTDARWNASRRAKDELGVAGDCAGANQVRTDSTRSR